MKKQNYSCEAKVEIISKQDAILLVEKQDAQNVEGIDFKYNDNVATISARNTANAKMGDVVKLNVSKRNFDIYMKILYFAPLLFLLAGFLFALKFESVIYQLVFAVCLFLVGTLLCLIAVAVLSALGKPKLEVSEVIKAAEIAKTESESVEIDAENVENSEPQTTDIEEVNND